MSWNNLKKTWQRLISNTDFKALISSPVTQIVGINTVMFVPCFNKLASLENKRCIRNILS